MDAVNSHVANWQTLESATSLSHVRYSRVTAQLEVGAGADLAHILHKAFKFLGLYIFSGGYTHQAKAKAMFEVLKHTVTEIKDGESAIHPVGQVFQYLREKLKGCERKAFFAWWNANLDHLAHYEESSEFLGHSLIEAIKLGHDRLALHFVQRGDPMTSFARSTDGMTSPHPKLRPLNQAVASGREVVVKAMLDRLRQSSIDEQTQQAILASALHRAITSNQEGIAIQIVSAGAPVDSVHEGKPLLKI